MKKILLATIIFCAVILVFFAWEIVAITCNAPMPNVIRQMFGIAFAIMALITIAYLLYCKIVQHSFPELISLHIVEIVVMSVVLLTMAIFLIHK